jgi:hypothetical protein
MIYFSNEYTVTKIIKTLHKINNAGHYHLILITRSIGVIRPFKNNKKQLTEPFKGLKILANDSQRKLGLKKS